MRCVLPSLTLFIGSGVRIVSSPLPCATRKPANLQICMQTELHNNTACETSHGKRCDGAFKATELHNNTAHQTYTRTRPKTERKIRIRKTSATIVQPIRMSDMVFKAGRRGGAGCEIVLGEAGVCLCGCKSLPRILCHHTKQSYTKDASGTHAGS